MKWARDQSVLAQRDPMYPDVEAHPYIHALIVMTTSRLLADDGVSEEVAGRLAAAFFAAT